ncbi:integrase arm-type DNA-binding domain-containing protein [Emcibacter sp. SYSU 3D8]|uniref:tyrosine-type recombinase/integrase n=1 Tax=Emcibacter sp. SYSU 3D8 TaxID=3133969 RepID=UPI0031FF332D
MSLTYTAIRAAKPRAKPYKLADEKGLFLLVQPSGGLLWRLKYRADGKEKKLSLGTYPATSLSDARARRDAARKLLEASVDPGAARKQKQAEQALSIANTFKSVAMEYIDKIEREGRTASTTKKARWFLELLAPIGERPVAEISPQELLATLKKQEARGRLETAQRLRSFAARVFRYAVATTRASSNPAEPLRGALVSPRVKHRAAILEPKRVGELLRAIEGYEGQPTTMAALKLAPHVFVRPGELRHAEWAEIDFDKAVWIIPAGKMKMRQPHSVPLSKQAVAILHDVQRLTGRGRYVFPSTRSAARPMSENTITAALRRMGYGGDEMTGHGFRSTASTLLNESGRWSADAIERALAHKDADLVRAAYHRGAHWKERVEMAAWWSNYLDKLRAGGEIIQLSRITS